MSEAPAYRKDIWAVVPVKDTRRAKQRLATVMDQDTRRLLAHAMLEDVLSAIAAASSLAGLVVVTADPIATQIAQRYGARLLSEGGEEGQTHAMRYAVEVLAAEGRRAILTLPIDIPLITAVEIDAVVAAARRDPEFVIVPAHDRQGSNAILCAPPGYVPLSFGNHSFAPHLATARQRGIEPRIIELPGIGRDIDSAADLAAFLAIPSRTRTRRLLDGLKL
ncbi:MAG: 2-phospho-L-lactate guanylyltransferase [Xanthobacteraceae bacterium]|nr:2-phospho-L-lactate guanylyltransferase [Xanthobacteraceae bacterium]